MTASNREAALVALDSLLAAVLTPLAPGVIWKGRNVPLTERLDLVISGAAVVVAGLADGDAQEPTALLGAPPLYEHLHIAALELISAHADAAKRDAAMDAALVALAQALAADETLGGVCDSAMPGVPVLSQLDEEGVPHAKATELPIQLLFTSASPIG